MLYGAINGIRAKLCSMHKAVLLGMLGIVASTMMFGVFMVNTPTVSAQLPQCGPGVEAPCRQTCSVKTFFGVPPWYKYLVSSGRMAPNNVTGACELVNQFKWGDIILIALALLDMAFRLAGLAAVLFVIYGGFLYVTSDGQPDKTKDAQTTIINALIGLAIALVAASVVSFIGNRLG